MSEPEVEAVESPASLDQAMENTIRENLRSLTAEPEIGDEVLTERASGEQALAKEPNTNAEQNTGKGATPARGADGKFVSPPAGDANQSSPGAGMVEAKPYDAFPQSWKKDHEAKWKALDPTLREEIHRREQNFLDGLKEYKEPAAFGRALAADLMPHLDTFRKLNTTPQAVVREVMGAWSMLVNGTPQQKRDTLLQTARAYGIELSAGPASSPPNGAAPPAPPPDFSPVLQRVESLEQVLQAQRAEADRLNQERVDQEIAAFGSNPKNAHFSAVREEMGRLIQAGSATTLQDAYDKAVWAHPETRAKLLAEEAASLSKRQAEEAAAARKAASANVTRRGTPPAVQKPGSMDDTIRSEFRRLTAEA